MIFNAFAEQLFVVVHFRPKQNTFLLRSTIVDSIRS